MGAIRFGQTGWRARIDDGFDEPGVRRVAHALGATWASRYEGFTVMVGYDVRRHSRRFALAAGEALASHGLNVVVSDRVCPTPALGWAVAHDPSCIGGVMITAARMPYTYGGMQVRMSDGGPMSSSFAAAVAQRIKEDQASGSAEVSLADFVTPYIDALVTQADVALISAAKPRVVVDALYGCTNGVAPELYTRLGCEVVALHNEPVSDFRGLHPDACEPWVDECEREVLRSHADLGVVFDGDGSRFAIVDASGKLVSPHDLAPLALEHIVNQRGQRGRVVGTVATSARIARKAEALGCDYTLAGVGIGSIYREFYEDDVILATDESGSLVVPRHLPERDGLMGSVMLLELYAGTGDSMADLVKRLDESNGTMTYVARDLRLDSGATQRLRNMLPGLNPPEVEGMVPVSVSHADGLRLSFADGSWLLVRASRSGAVVRLAAEAPSPAAARALLAAAARLAR